MKCEEHIFLTKQSEKEALQDYLKYLIDECKEYAGYMETVTRCIHTPHHPRGHDYTCKWYLRCQAFQEYLEKLIKIA